MADGGERPLDPHGRLTGGVGVLERAGAGAAPAGGFVRRMVSRGAPHRDPSPPRRVVAALPAASLALLRSRLPRTEVLSLDAHRVGEPAVACLVDPGFLEEHAPAGGWLESVPRDLPLVIWAGVSPRGVRGVAAAAALRPVRILVDGVDDVASMLEGLLASMPRLAHAHRLQEALKARLERVPAPIRGACLRAIEVPESFFDATDLARAALMSRRHLDRILAHCGFAPGKAVVVGSRVWLAHCRIATEGRSVPEAARSLGYADMKALLRHVRAVTGEGAAGFRQLPAERCMDRVIHHIAPT